MMILKQDKQGNYTRFGDDPRAFLANVHSESACAGRGCAIHNHPSAHPLDTAPLNWREDRGILERICEHGVGHPDADSARFLSSIGQDAQNVHGCDGCCVAL